MTKPKHIAISLDNIFDYCRKNNININECYDKYFELLNKLLDFYVKTDIPVLTFYLLHDIEKSASDYLTFVDYIADFFNDLSNKPLIYEYKIKISIFGKWFNLPGKVIESLKNIIEKTKDFDSFFINFCINYDGQEEIVDACKLIAKQVELGKIDAEMITKDTIKESIYSSYFLPPDIILIYGERKLTGLLLWDSANSKIVFADKSFMDFEEEDLEWLFL